MATSVKKVSNTAKKKTSSVPSSLTSGITGLSKPATTVNNSNIYSTTEGNKVNSNQKDLTSFNSDIESTYKKNADGSYTNSKGYKMYKSSEADKNGVYHYGFKQDRADQLTGEYNQQIDAGTATYNANGYSYVKGEEPVQNGFSIDTSGVMSDAEAYARDLEKIKSYYDQYLGSMQDAGKAAADEAYEANSQSVYNTWRGANADLQENYNRDSSNKQNELQESRNAYIESRNNVGKNAFSAIQQGRENAASRGLSNSGLMQALDQSTMNQANEARAAIDSQYNENVAKLNNEISLLVQNYGIGKKEADDIYNTSLQSLEAQRQSEYEKVVGESTQKAIEYQFGVDQFNAKAYNDASSQLADIAKDVWSTKVNNETQYAIADLQAKNNMSIAQMQDKTDRYIANADNKTKKWLAQYDRKTQMIITNLSGDIQKEIAKISGSYGVAAATQAASIAASADKYNMNVAAMMESTNAVAEENGWSKTQYSKALTYISNGDTAGLQKYIANTKGTKGGSIYSNPNNVLGITKG